MQSEDTLIDILDYQHPAVTVDIVLFTIMHEDLKVLLVQRGHEPFPGFWSLPGGFVQMDESLEQAALDKLKEKTNVTDVYLEQLYTFGDPGRDPRAHVITIAYYALVSSEKFQLRPSEAVSDIGWHSVYALPPLAFDHQRIVALALSRLRNKLGYTTLGFQLLPEKFTLPELCRVYEVILNKQIDKRNFRKKVAFLDIVEETGETTQVFSKKPARLYRFKQTESQELQPENKNVFIPKIPRSLQGS
jgi:8-oxo-dGTP diphosphatase